MLGYIRKQYEVREKNNVKFITVPINYRVQSKIHMTFSHIGEENPPKQNVSSSKQFCPLAPFLASATALGQGNSLSRRALWWKTSEMYGLETSTSF